MNKAVFFDTETTGLPLFDQPSGAAEPPLECGVMQAELEALKALMSELLDQLGERDRGDGNAPGHCHEIPGVWDSDNGKLAGKPCAWCAMWNKAKATGLVHNGSGEPGRLQSSARP